MTITQKPTADGKGVTLTTRLFNNTKKKQRIALRSRCPAPPVVLRGLPAEVDPATKCSRDPCRSLAPVVVNIAPKKSVELSKTVVLFDGNECAAPLPPGEHIVSFAIEPVDIDKLPRTCGPYPVTLERPDESKRPHECKHIACGIACEGPMARDKYGCTLCACDDSQNPRKLLERNLAPRPQPPRKN